MYKCIVKTEGIDRLITVHNCKHNYFVVVTVSGENDVCVYVCVCVRIMSCIKLEQLKAIRLGRPMLNFDNQLNLEQWQ